MAWIDYYLNDGGVLDDDRTVGKAHRIQNMVGAHPRSDMSAMVVRKMILARKILPRTLAIPWCPCRGPYYNHILGSLRNLGFVVTHSNRYLCRYLVFSKPSSQPNKQSLIISCMLERNSSPRKIFHWRWKKCIEVNVLISIVIVNIGRMAHGVVHGSTSLLNGYKTSQKLLPCMHGCSGLFWNVIGDIRHKQ